MRLATIGCVLWVLYLSSGDSFCAASQIEGTVLMSDGAPVAAAVVSASSAAIAQHPTATTDKSGHFVIKNVSSGTYVLLVNKPELGSSLMGVSKHLTVSSGVSDYQVEFKLPKPSSISGRVLDNYDRPLGNIPVDAWLQATVRGERTVLFRGIVTTDTRGEYRFWGLPEGTYLIRARPSMMKPTLISSQLLPQPSTPAFVTTFYPSSIDNAAASPIRLLREQELSGFDIKIQMPMTNCIRVRVVETGANKSELSVMIFGSGLFATYMLEELRVASGSRVEFCGLSSGEYNFSVLDLRGSELEAYGNANVYVGDKTIDLGSIQASPLKDLTSSISYDSEAKLPDEKFSGLVLEVEPLRHLRAAGEGEQSSIAPDGSFEIRRLTSDQYRLRVIKSPPGTYVKSAACGIKDALREPFSADAPLRIVLSVDGGALSGGVVDSNGFPIGDAKVLLLDAHNLTSANLGEIRSCTSDQNGHFSFPSGLKPGDYKILAAQGLITDIGWLSPSLFSGAALDVSIAAKESKTIQLVGFNAAQ